jgi:hypothetical protein
MVQFHGLWCMLALRICQKPKIVGGYESQCCLKKWTPMWLPHVIIKVEEFIK